VSGRSITTDWAVWPIRAEQARKKERFRETDSCNESSEKCGDVTEERFFRCLLNIVRDLVFQIGLGRSLHQQGTVNGNLLGFHVNQMIFVYYLHTMRLNNSCHSISLNMSSEMIFKCLVL